MAAHSQPAARTVERHDARANQTLYTCPMHPEVQQLGPGTCPKCGMALEPKEVTGEEVNPELNDMTRRFLVSVALTVPMPSFMVSTLIPGDPLSRIVGANAAHWIQFALATPVILWGVGRFSSAPGFRSGTAA
jgi:Cu+-exporting ATPase